MFKKYIYLITIPFSVLFLLSFPVFSQEKILLTSEGEITGEINREHTNQGNNIKKEPIEITADQLEMQDDKNMLVGKGNVDIYYKNTHIHADKVQVNTKTGKGIASGHVVLEDKSSKVSGDKTFFNINTKKGEIFNARGHLVSEYFFTGENVKKVGEDQYKVFNGTLTTCFGDKPAWLFKCDYIDMTLENHAFMKNPKFYIKDIPVFYLPYGYISLKTKRATGFLFPILGSSSKDGIFFNNSFFWAINDQMDATLSLDYLSKKGVRPGLEFRYTPTRKMTGQFNGTYIKEKDTNSKLWKIDFNHRQELNYEILAVARADLLSDDNYDKAYASSTQNRTRRISDSYLSLSKNWTSRSLAILTRYRKSLEFDREEKYTLLPQITFRNQREKIVNSPFYFNMESSYAGFDRKISSSSDNVKRFDLHPQVSLPITNLPWMTFTPTIGLRETYYSEGMGSGGIKTGGFSRQLYDITTSLEGPKFSKIFDFNNSVVEKVKHIIEPRITHQYIADVNNLDSDKIIIFDGIDTISSLNILKYSLTNRFLQKLILDENSFTTKEALRFEISQSYDIRETTRSITAGTSRRPFSDIRWDIDSNIWTPLRLNFDGSYDLVYDNELKTANIELGITPASFWTLYFERRYTKDQSTFIIGTLGLDLKKGWSAAYSTRYDELNNKFQENDFTVKYSAQCWDITLDYVDRNVFINGQEQKENKVFFFITLKGIGSIGTKPGVKIAHRGL